MNDAQKRDARRLAESRAKREREQERNPKRTTMASDDCYRDGMMNEGHAALLDKEGYRS